MSVWSGLVAAGVAIALAIVIVGQPMWEWRLEGPNEVESWAYGPFDARHTVVNRTTGNISEDLPYDYATQLPLVQPNMAAAFSGFGSYFLLGIVAAITGIGLSALSAWKKVRGLFAGVALLGSCAAFLYAGISLFVSVPTAATADGLIPSSTFTEPPFGGQATGPQGTSRWTPVTGWILVLVSGVAAAWGSSDLWHVRPARKRTPAAAKGSTAARAGETVPPPPPPPEDLRGATPTEPDIEEVFVIAPNGLLIKHMSHSLMTDKDRDVVGSMISAISNFVREAFTERDGEVHEVTLGEHRFVMCTDPDLVVAVLVKFGETEVLVHRLRHLLVILQNRYGPKLLNWQGQPLEGIEDEISVLWEPHRLPPPPTA